MKTEIYTTKGSRKYFKCVCDSCSEDFTRRSDSKQFDTCPSCSLKIAGKLRQTHGDNNKNSRLHCTWANMKRRCLNPTKKEIRNYRSKGITLCDEWHSYQSFKDWALKNGYNDKLCIDRIDNDLGYSPSNCRFVDYSVQNANKGITNKNTTGFIGVTKHKKKFAAKIDWKGETIWLGYHDTAEQAAKVRNAYITENNLPHTLNTTD